MGEDQDELIAPTRPTIAKLDTPPDVSREIAAHQEEEQQRRAHEARLAASATLDARQLRRCLGGSDLQFARET